MSERPSIEPLSHTYADARAGFLEAAARVEARVSSFEHPYRGLNGEALYVDVAEVGPAPAPGENVIIVVSGTHGVEGYLGSALQRHHLQLIDSDRTTGPTYLFIHALNPYGVSWTRRVNEDNVDLNRNFIDWSKPLPSNEGYSELADLLVPSSWTEEVQQQTLDGLMSELGERGFPAFQQLVSGGQYDHAGGIFYGGREPVWSHRWLRGFIAERLVNVAHAAILDLHTGLGPWGHGELISLDHPDSARFARQVEWWHDVTSVLDGSSVSADVSGDWLGAIGSSCPQTELTGIAIEYGTVDAVSVLQSLRADAVLHAYGDPTGAGAADIRQQVREAFLDDDPAWLEACWSRYRAVATISEERLS